MPPNDTLTKLHETLQELNHRADVASKQLKATETVLAQMNSGITITLPEAFLGTCHLGFCKIPEVGWKLVVYEEGVSANEPTPVLESSRLIRIRAANHTGKLLEAILAAAEEQVRLAKEPGE
jgi:hypothetical protein